MAVVYSPNVIEIAVRQSQAGRPVTNVLHMWFDAELGSDTVEDVVGDVRDNWQDHVMVMCTADLVVNEFAWLSLDESRPGAGSINPDPTKFTAGQLVTPSMPPNVTYLIRKNTENRPRGRRDGRLYQAGVAENAINAAGAVEAQTRADLDTYWALFYNGVSDTSGAGSGDRYPCVLETTELSRDPEAPPQTIASRRVISFTADSTAATQRNRLR